MSLKYFHYKSVLFPFENGMVVLLNRGIVFISCQCIFTMGRMKCEKFTTMTTDQGQFRSEELT